MRGTAKLLFTGLAALCVVGVLTLDADAQRGRRGRRAASPDRAAVAEAMDNLEWGMSKEQLMRHFVAQIHEEYKPKFRKVTGAIEEDRLRHKLREDIRRVRESYVEFDGTTTGWDVSFLRGEFTHNNNEAMIVVRDEEAQNFYFLINGKFWKLYRAFNSEVFAGSSFDQFANALQGRFGRAARKEGSLHEGARPTRWLEWKNRDTRLRAVDNTTFYGFYCLVFESRDMLGKLDRLRVNKSKSGNKSHSLVDSVTSGEVEANPDNHPNVVDRITGRNRGSSD